MKRKLFPIVVMAAVALVSASCSSSKKTSNDMVVSRNNMAEVDRGFLILSDAQRALTANNNDFALQLFGKAQALVLQLTELFLALKLLGVVEQAQGLRLL